MEKVGEGWRRQRKFEKVRERIGEGWRKFERKYETCMIPASDPKQQRKNREQKSGTEIGGHRGNRNREQKSGTEIRNSNPGTPWEQKSGTEIGNRHREQKSGDTAGEKSGEKSGYKANP